MNSLIKLFVNQKLMSFGTASKTLSTNLWTQIYHPKRLPLKQVSRGLTQLSTVALGKKNANFMIRHAGQVTSNSGTSLKILDVKLTDK